MSKRCALKVVLFLTLLALTGSLISCVPTPESVEVAEAGSRVWIDFPRDGASAPVGVSVFVVSHAYAKDGAAEVLLSVNGTAYRRDAPAAVGDSLVEVRQEWIPTEPGLYTLEVRAYNAAGEASGSDAITVRVTGEAIESPTEVPPATGVPTGVPTSTATPVPTETPAPTSTPVPTNRPTDVPVPTATFTPIPPVEVNFWVDDDSLNTGQCATLHWDVEHATAVFLDGVGVAGHGTSKVCPTSTTTYVLHVEAPSGNVDRSVVVTVNDTTPPPVPTPYVPANGLEIGCTDEQTLAWLPVDDPSGVVYYVKLEQKVTATQWKSVRGWGPVSGKEVVADVDCGGIYRWTVRAEDGVGNISAWSAWYNFSVTMD